MDRTIDKWTWLELYGITKGVRSRYVEFPYINDHGELVHQRYEIDFIREMAICEATGKGDYDLAIDMGLDGNTTKKE